MGLDTILMRMTGKGEPSPDTLGSTISQAYTNSALGTKVSQTFAAVSGILNQKEASSVTACGLPASVVNGANSKYIVSISSNYIANGGNTQTNVYAFLQENVKMGVRSHWGSIAQGFGGLNDFANEGLQFLAFRSIVSTVGTRRKWTGSDPVNISLKLRFEAFDNPKSDVVDACRVLQKLTLPRKGLNSGGWFLVPPGPNPFAMQGITNGDKLGELTTIRVGQFLIFNRVIIDSVDVTFDPRMGVTGPIGATVILQFSTYEILTKDMLDDVYLIPSEGVRG
jgi:hypothetical protein